MRLLLIEDEQALRDNIQAFLQQKGFAVQVAADGEEGVYYGKEYPFDLAVIDLGLPKLSGFEVIESLRRDEIAFPILILTAQGQWQDKVKGLEAGADDYLTKPFHTEELLARINALIRRSSGYAKPELTLGPISLNSLTQDVTVNGTQIELTSYEYKVLEYMMLHPDKVISKTELTEHIYEQDNDKDSNVIEVFVGRLRKKIQQAYAPPLIETLRGRGYKLKSQ